jgi:hypothetical protein
MSIVFSSAFIDGGEQDETESNGKSKKACVDRPSSLCDLYAIDANPGDGIGPPHSTTRRTCSHRSSGMHAPAFLP